MFVSAIMNRYYLWVGVDCFFSPSGIWRVLYFVGIFFFCVFMFYTWLGDGIIGKPVWYNLYLMIVHVLVVVVTADWVRTWVVGGKLVWANIVTVDYSNVWVFVPQDAEMVDWVFDVGPWEDPEGVE